MSILRYILNRLIPAPCKEWPQFPNELVHRIFDFAAASSKETCKSLMLVNSSARMIALRHLNRVIVLDDPWKKDGRRFPLEAFDPERKLISPYTFTRYLFCSPEIDFVVSYGTVAPRLLVPTVINILSNCTHIQSLCMGVKLLSDTLKWPHDGLPSDGPQHDLELTLRMDGRPARYTLSHPSSRGYAQVFYQKVTRLHLHFATEVDHFDILANYPNVTHLAFYATAFRDLGISEFEAVLERLRSLESLQVIVIMIESEFDWMLPFPPFPTLLDFIGEHRKRDNRLLAAVMERGNLEPFKKGCVEGSLWEQALAFSLSVGLVDI